MDGKEEPEAAEEQTGQSIAWPVVRARLNRAIGMKDFQRADTGPLHMLFCGLGRAHGMSTGYTLIRASL